MMQEPQKIDSTASVSNTRQRPTTALLFFLVVSVAIYRGWNLSDEGYLTAERGVGYILGIVGASMMLGLLLYPVRKHLRSLRNFGQIRYWFWAHMVLGILGPALILFHANFQLGSLNSTTALVCMLIVATSGLIGRFLYSRIHFGLYGRRATARELSSLARQNREKLEWSQSLNEAVTHGLDKLDVITARIESQRQLTMLQWLRETQKAQAIRREVSKTIVRSLQELAREQQWSAKELRHRRRDSLMYLQEFFNASRKAQQLDFYARLFALWHVVHLPFFFMMILAAIVHVVAVHVY